jgi:hypothetical protein
MGLRQTFRFKHASPEAVRAFLLGLSELATTEDRGQFFVFSERPGEEPFTFDCELTSEGIQSDRAGAYFAFLGLFIEALTGTFGRVEVEDQ